MKNTTIIIVVLIVLGASAWLFLGNSKLPTGNSGVVATVNSEEITRADFNTLQTQVATAQNIDLKTLDADAKTQFETQIVDTLVSQALLRQAIADSEMTVTDEQVDAQIETTKGQFETEEAYMAALKTGNLTEDQLRTNIRTELLTQAYLEQELKLSAVTANETEITTAYEQADFGEGEVPPLAEVRAQVEAFVIQQKQQALVNQFVETLRESAEVEILL